MGARLDAERGGSALVHGAGLRVRRRGEKVLLQAPSGQRVDRPPGDRARGRARTQWFWIRCRCWCGRRGGDDTGTRQERASGGCKLAHEHPRGIAVSFLAGRHPASASDHHYTTRKPPPSKSPAKQQSEYPKPIVSEPAPRNRVERLTPGYAGK